MSTKRLAATICLAIAAAAVIYFSLVRLNTIVDTDASAQALEHKPEAVLLAMPLEDNKSTRTSEAKPEVASTAAAASPLTWPRTISGDLLLQTAEGAPVMAIRGGINFSELAKNGRATHTRARVQDGKWSLTVVSESALTPETVEINTDTSPQQSLRAFSDGVSFSSTVAAGPTIRAILEKGPLVHVVDETSRSEVAECDLIIAPMGESFVSEDAQAPPNNLLGAAQHITILPHELPAFLGTRVGWARTRTSAWRRFAVCREDVTVVIQEGADLEVTVTKLETSPMPMLVRVYTSAPEYARPLLLAEQRVTQTGVTKLTGLPVGPASVRLDKLGPARPGTVVASRSINIVTGSRNAVVLDADEALSNLGRVIVRLKRPKGVPFKADGVIFIIEDASDSSQSNPLLVDPKDASVTEEGVEWKGPALLPGSYIVTVAPLNVASQFAIAAGGTAIVEFELVAACSLEIVVKGENGTVHSGANLLVRPLLAKSPVAWRDIRPNPNTKSYHLTSQPGKLQVVYPGMVGAERIQVIDASERQKTYEIAVVRGPAIEITAVLTDGKSNIALPESFWTVIGVEAIDGDGRLLATRSLAEQIGAYTNLDTARMGYTVSKPGLYRFTVPKWPGFIKPSVVDIMIEESGGQHLLLVQAW